jgi:hypothetical protein
VAGSCERFNEPSGCIKGGEFLDQLSNYQFFSRKDPYHGVGTFEFASGPFYHIDCFPSGTRRSKG